MDGDMAKKEKEGGRKGREGKCSRAFCGQIKAKMKKVRGGKKVMKQ